MFKAVVSADLMARAYIAASTEATRYYLNGVYIEPCAAGGVLLVATDGHRMLVLRDPAGYCEGSAIVALTPATLKACKAKMPRGYAERYMIAHGEKIAIASVSKPDNAADLLALADNPSQEVEAYQVGALIDGSFPDWRRVVPSEDVPAAPHSPCFAAAYVGDFGKALSSGKSLHITIRAAADTDPHWIFGDGSVEGFGVLMPVRVDRKRGEHPQTPNWWRDRPQMTEAAE